MQLIHKTWNTGGEYGMVLDIVKLKKYIDEKGLKQKFISERSNIPEPKLSQILSGKRKCEVGEYANICKALGVEFQLFIVPETKKLKYEAEKEAR